MLRIEFEGSLNDMTMRVEGRFAGTYAKDALDLVLHKVPSHLLMDLSEVTFVDAVGEAVLSCFGRLGAQFISNSLYAHDVCERLQLPLAVKPSSTLPEAT